MTPSLTLGFGDEDAGIWGVAWTGAGEAVMVGVGSASAGEVMTATLTGAEATDEWRLEGTGIELVVAPASPPVAGDQPGGAEGFDQLSRVTGRLAVGGTEQPVDTAGWRAARDGALNLQEIESFRHVAAWFGPGDGLALSALRPRGARGQESDVVAAAIFEPEHAPRVADPRLSTTYTAAGVPTRAGLELWLEEDEPEDPASEDDHEQFPRRAAGEVSGPGLDWEAEGFALHAAPLRWHSRGEDGTGIYLLGRRG